MKAVVRVTILGVEAGVSHFRKSPDKWSGPHINPVDKLKSVVNSMTVNEKVRS